MKVLVLVGTLLSLSVVGLSQSTASAAAILAHGDSCDWAGSGLEYKEEERSVRPVYLRCQQGALRWKYPRGALRVVLRLGTAGNEFKGCIRATSGDESGRFKGARVYLEGERQLHQILAPDDGKATDLWRCFASVHGQVALYVEADASAIQQQVAKISYHLTPVASSADSECSPCSDEELLRNYCTADFIAIGEIIDARDNVELERSELKVRASKVLADRAQRVDGPETEMVVFYGKEATVHVPLKCGVRRASGHERFLVLGRMVLGEPRLLCAPRIDHWDRVKRRALEQDTNQCNLD